MLPGPLSIDILSDPMRSSAILTIKFDDGLLLFEGIFLMDIVRSLCSETVEVGREGAHYIP